MVALRGWQQEALRRFDAHDKLCFLLEATPGAGKTIFSGLCAAQLVDHKEAKFCVIVVPTRALKGDKHAGFLGDWHKAGVELASNLRDGRPAPIEFGGAIITYQQLPNIVNTIETWAANGTRLFVVFDEIHHATESNVWGAAAERLARCSVKVLAMTGTPFRSDGRKISFVEYSDAGKAVADYTYAYQQAVRDIVCRPISFMTDDGIAQFINNEIEGEVRLSEAKTDEDTIDAARTIFRRDSKWLQTVLERADAKLDEYRVWDVDAGGLVICRPGLDENDDKHLRGIAALVRKVTGEDPEIVCHDDQDAIGKIERFRTGTKRWICAVRQISEGVDIKRLRVEVLANRPTTELLFRQVIGRVVRVDNEQRPGDATVFIAKFPQLTEWSKRIREEAEAGLHERDLSKSREGERQETESLFIPGQTTHEEGGAISDFGDEFTAAEINAAEREKASDHQLFDIPVTKLAYLYRKLGHKPDPMQPVSDPLYIQKKELRQLIISSARRLAIARDSSEPDYKAVFVDLHKITGAKNIDDLTENFSLDVMRQALQIVNGWLGQSHA